MKNKEIDNIIHDNIIPLQQKFISYADLFLNPGFRPDYSKACKQLAQYCQNLIDEYRKLSEVHNNKKEAGKC